MIKALEIKPSVVLNLVFTNNTISSCFFFFKINCLYSLIPAIIARIFNYTAELIIPIGIVTKEVIAEMKFKALNEVLNVIQSLTNFYVFFTH